MPIYAYRCESCGFGKDVLQKMSDPQLTQCPECGKDSFRKQVTAAGFQLKGSGWYVTDFRGGNNGAPATAKADANSDAKADSNPGTGEAAAAKSDTAKSDSGSSSTASGSSSAAAAPAAPAAAPATSSGSGSA